MRFHQVVLQERPWGQWNPKGWYSREQTVLWSAYKIMRYSIFSKASAGSEGYQNKRGWKHQQINIYSKLDDYIHLSVTSQSALVWDKKCQQEQYTACNPLISKHSISSSFHLIMLLSLTSHTMWYVKRKRLIPKHITKNTQMTE